MVAITSNSIITWRHYPKSTLLPIKVEKCSVASAKLQCKAVLSYYHLWYNCKRFDQTLLSSYRLSKYFAFKNYSETILKPLFKDRLICLWLQMICFYVWRNQRWVWRHTNKLDFTSFIKCLCKEKKHFALHANTIWVKYECSKGRIPVSCSKCSQLFLSRLWGWWIIQDFLDLVLKLPGR